MDLQIIPGSRCRATRPITHPGGVLSRSSEGTVCSFRENIGRNLVTVAFDSGERLVLFPHEIEPVGELAA
ncbi:MAG TPA: hypothetical protein VFD92_00300 [Candidatus Binatia bacterium]|nr:hypothetical protein [Candidatus Binatia bacterium]